MNNGAYIYMDTYGEVVLMIYKKLEPPELQDALPLTDTVGKTHLCMHFVGGKDYVGASTEEDIERQILDYNMQNLQHTSVPILGMSEKKFTRMKEFAERQLNIEL